MAVSIVVSPARFDDSDPTELLREAVRNASHAPGDEHLLSVIAGCGEQTIREFVSLMHRMELAAGGPRVRRARFDYDCEMPVGADPDAAAGLPLFMTVGVSAEGPWWYCRLCRRAHIGLVDTDLEYRGAVEHVVTYHARKGGGPGE
jgi:hypothetical protein